MDKTAEAKRLLQLTSREEFDKTYKQCEALVAFNEQDRYAAEEQIRRTNSTLRTAMYGLGLGGVVLGLLLEELHRHVRALIGHFNATFSAFSPAAGSSFRRSQPH